MTSYGYVMLNLKVGPIRARTKFYVMNMDTSYHTLLGQPWLNKHKLIASTYHKCAKGKVNGRLIRIPQNQILFHQRKSHYTEVETEFHDEITH